MYFGKPLATSLLLLAALLFITAPQPGLAQPNNAAYRDLLLFSQFGEFCTMCEAVLICAEGEAIPEESGVPGGGSFTLYHLKTRTFWSQIYTIWEWFIAPFQDEPISGHKRPADQIDVRDGQWFQRKPVEVHIALEPPHLTFDGYVIERRSRAWLSNTGAVGFCARLPLWESLEAIESNLKASNGIIVEAAQ